jgi:hypothetical protein
MRRRNLLNQKSRLKSGPTNAKLNLAICIPNPGNAVFSAGPLIPTASVGPATIEGRVPNQLDVGKNIILEGPGGNPNLVYQITGVDNSLVYSTQLGVTDFTSAPPNSCGSGFVIGRKVNLEICSISPNMTLGGPPASFTNPSLYCSLNGQEIQNSDIGRTVRFHGGIMGIPGQRYIIKGFANAPAQLQGTPTALITASPCPNPNPLYGCTDPQAINFSPQAQLDDGSCQYAPRPNPNQNFPRPMARKGRGLSDNRMNRYKKLIG